MMMIVVMRRRLRKNRILQFSMHLKEVSRQGAFTMAC
jgi:hypothetical protein